MEENIQITFTKSVLEQKGVADIFTNARQKKIIEKQGRYLE